MSCPLNFIIVLFDREHIYIAMCILISLKIALSGMSMASYLGYRGGNKNNLLIVSGMGDVMEPDGNVCAIGSGGNYALAAARALYEETDLSAEEVAKKALKIASEICIFTNDNIRCEVV